MAGPAGEGPNAGSKFKDTEGNSGQAFVDAIDVVIENADVVEGLIQNDGYDFLSLWCAENSGSFFKNAFSLPGFQTANMVGMRVGKNYVTDLAFSYWIAVTIVLKKLEAGVYGDSIILNSQDCRGRTQSLLFRINRTATPIV